MTLYATACGTTRPHSSGGNDGGGGARECDDAHGAVSQHSRPHIPPSVDVLSTPLPAALPDHDFCLDADVDGDNVAKPFPESGQAN